MKCYYCQEIKTSFFISSSDVARKNKNDSLIVKFDTPASLAHVATKSSLFAHPVKWNKQQLKKAKQLNVEAKCEVLFISSGNANVFNGQEGYSACQQIAQELQSQFNCNPNNIFLCATGTIGQKFSANNYLNNFKKIIVAQNIKQIVKFSQLNELLKQASKAISTTDTKYKYLKKIHQPTKNSPPIYVVAFAKGSGMINPNMATMLSFVITNANVKSEILQKLLQNSTKYTYNCISVDGDMSTNDTVFTFASAEQPITKGNKNNFYEILHNTHCEMAHKIIQDGEGANHIVNVIVEQAKNYKTAKIFANSIANSMLIKTMLHGKDPNFGRIAMAIGKTQLPIQQEKIKIFINDKQINANLISDEAYERQIKQIMSKKSYAISIQLGIGQATANVYTTDLSHQYIDINADYRS